MRGDVERRSKRWLQQRWLMDTVVETIGIEWEQERLSHYARPAGPAAAAHAPTARCAASKWRS